MHKKLFFSVAVFAFYANGFSQEEKPIDSIEEVVITGQFNPQSIKKSLYKVEVISSEDIQRMAANTVAEVLNQSLNILIIPEKNSGDSKASILGLGADYTKVLVDNIPVVGDTGLGSNIDLTKLSLDTIERIEIVKGSMGVEFGNNAIAGVINIITKKSAQRQWVISGFVQEETAGKEYDWVEKGKGRHVQSLNLSHNISDKWYVSAAITRHDFQGFRGDLKGRNHFGVVDGNSVNIDGLRGYYWQPKEIVNPSFVVRYGTPKTQIFYKFDYLSEEINFYNPIVETQFLGAGERRFLANDKDYLTSRMLHHFDVQTQVFTKAKLSSDFSYQKQSRKKQDYIYDIPAREVISARDKEVYYEAETFYSRSSLSQFLNTESVDLQLGYEADYTRGFAGWSTSSFGGSNVLKDVFNVGVFTAAEFQLVDNWFVRPGIRVNFSDTFKTKPNVSLVLKNKINESSEFRAIVGTANRNPTFEELFTYFVDSNHDIRGNENLKPENSYSGTLFYSIHNKSNTDYKWSVDVSSMYILLEDKIDVTVVNEAPMQYRFINIDTYESWQNTMSAKFSKKQFGLNAGFSLLGRAMVLETVKENKYRYSTEINASAYYQFLPTKTSFALYFKAVGKSYSIREDSSLGVKQNVLFKRNAFTLMDVSLSQKLWKDHFVLSVGVKNLLNVSSIDNLGIGGGTHGTANAGERLFYGRSYFGRINFNF